MTSDEKQREWWIRVGPKGSQTIRDTAPDPLTDDSYIHVIEKSAYDRVCELADRAATAGEKLKAELAECEASRMDLMEQLEMAKRCPGCDDLEDTEKERDALREQVEDMNKNCISLSLHDSRMHAAEERIKEESEFWRKQHLFVRETANAHIKQLDERIAQLEAAREQLGIKHINDMQSKEEHIVNLQLHIGQLTEALEWIAAQSSGEPGSTKKADCMAAYAKAALQPKGSEG